MVSDIARTKSNYWGSLRANFCVPPSGADKDRLRDRDCRPVNVEHPRSSLGDLAETDGVVNWRVEFAEVFGGARRGFDIAIANPPYTCIYRRT